MDEKTPLILRIFPAFWLILLPGLVSCIPTGNPDPDSLWLPSQVRRLDPSESAQNPFAFINPAQDLIAIYSRETDTQLQFRLDLLELELNSIFGLPLNPTSDIYLAINFLSENSHRDWDLLISIPAKGKPTAEYPQQFDHLITPIVQFNPQLDFLEISIDKALLPDLRPGYTLSATITAPESQSILDQIPAVNSTESIDPIPLSLAFWNTLPAHTPAQALRRWDGAHTGPLGERHGLKHLLAASSENQIPIILLDLKTPTGLAALALLGETQKIKALQQSGLLILPESLPEIYFGYLPAWANQRAAQTSRQTGRNFGLAGSSFLSASTPPKNVIPNYQFVFLRQPGQESRHLTTTRIYVSQGFRILPVPQYGSKTQQATPQGMSIETRRTLLQLALEKGSSGEMVVLGGDLSRSTFGDPRASKAAMEYIAGHPWMRVLSAAELLSLPAFANYTPTKPETIENANQPVLAAIRNAPDSPISDLAWQMYLDLSAPATPAIPELADLRANYFGEIGNLLAAAEWDAQRTADTNDTSIRNPVSINCMVDTDFDGQAECILANSDYFALVDPQGGRLALLFAGPTQLVGASSQFIVGLSDYQEWNLDAGSMADPATIPGALAGPWINFLAEPLPDGVRLTSPESEKVFWLSSTGLRVDIHSDNPSLYQIPLVVAPQRRFYAEWPTEYQEVITSQGLTWGIRNGPQAEIRVFESLSSHSFRDSAALLRDPENPNSGYPTGHFIPFPLAVVDLPALDFLRIEINLSSDQPLDQ